MIRERCRSDRLALRERIAALRSQAREESKEIEAGEIVGARTACGAHRADARRTSMDAVDEAQAAYESERSYWKDLRRIERGNRAKAQSRTRSTAAERRGESDDEVRGNISPELPPAFERIKRHIKATPLMSRTEAFLHWAEEHPDEVFHAIEEKAEAAIRDFEEQERAALQGVRRRSRASGSRGADDVPF